MSKVRMSVKSRRMVRRHREFFRLMDETGLSADQLRGALATRDALVKAAHELGAALSAVGIATACGMAPLIEMLAMIESDEEES